MATTLPSFPTKPPSTRYPWASWMNGSVWNLVQGSDFHVTPKAFQSAAYAQAKRIGKKLKTTIGDGSITIQCLPWSE